MPRGIAIRPSVWLCSGERFRVPLKITARRSSYLAGAASACASMKLWIGAGMSWASRPAWAAGVTRAGYVEPCGASTSRSPATTPRRAHSPAAQLHDGPRAAPARQSPRPECCCHAQDLAPGPDEDDIDREAHEAGVDRARGRIRSPSPTWSARRPRRPTATDALFVYLLVQYCCSLECLVPSRPPARDRTPLVRRPRPGRDCERRRFW